MQLITINKKYIIIDFIINISSVPVHSSKPLSLKNELGSDWNCILMLSWWVGR